jgi:ribonuclease PH
VSKRNDGRSPEELRPVRFERGYVDFAEGSCLVSFGRTRVVCAASLEKRTPPWMEGSGRGWVTAEYSMLPRSTLERTPREAARGRQSGRTQEIQRLIGRALRAVFDLKLMPDLSIVVDCDCLVADGGTRTAAITGGFVAVADALGNLREQGLLRSDPIRDHVAAVSVGIIDGRPCLDLDYSEDATADVDMNVVMTGSGSFVEVQGTAEGEAFDKSTLDEMLALAGKGIADLVDAQRAALS